MDGVVHLSGAEVGVPEVVGWVLKARSFRGRAFLEPNSLSFPSLFSFFFCDRELLKREGSDCAATDVGTAAWLQY